MIDFCLLGTGGMMPLPNRWLTSLLIRYNGKMLLIDCGEGTQIPLKQAGWGFKSIDAILFTHYHGDHIAGLPGLLLTLGNSGRTEPVTLLGPPGINEVVEGLTVITPEIPFSLNIIELSNETKKQQGIIGLTVESIPVDHSIPCLSYSIRLKRQGKFDAEKAKELNIPLKYWSQLQNGETITINNMKIFPQMIMGHERKGIKVCYCTDTRPTDKLIQFIYNSDLFICEGMYGDKKDFYKAVKNKHMIFSEAALLASKGNVGELILTHFSPALTEPDKFLENASRMFSNTVLGKDMYKRTLRFEE